MKRIIFKDELCDAKTNGGGKGSLTCQKGTLRFTGNNVEDFKIFHAWCSGCEKIKIIDRKEFTAQFKTFAKNLRKEVE